MTQASKYVRATDFSDEELANVGGRSTVRTAAVDSELDAVGVSLNRAIVNQILNQRDDGEIRDGRVKLFTLASDVLALLTAYGAIPRGAWLTTTAYALKDLVAQSGNTYIAVTPHTSGVFATDLAAGKWLLFSLSATPSATAVTFTPTATLSSTNVQLALDEADTENRALSAAAAAAAAAALAQANANDALLRADLLNSATAGKGASMSLFSQSTAQSAGSVGARLTEWKSVRDLPYGAVGNGTADDTTAITNALAGGGNVVIPTGFTFKITSYIQIPSNTTLLIYGTVQLTNRASGFYTNGASNVGVYGHKTGGFTDTTVAAGYVWNTSATIVAPAVHVRSSDNIVVDGLNFSYTRQGVLISNATTNVAAAGAWTLTQSVPTNVTVSNCKMTMIEGAGLACYNGLQVTYSNNYVGRSGDGGLWMMGAQHSRVINNHRYGAQTVAADVTTFGVNSAAHPTTWNDVQGMEFENCHLVLIQGNVVENMCQLPIDIKNNCAEISVFDNLIYNPESGGIVVREGDAVKNSNMRVSIRGNQIFNLGASQTGAPAGSYQGGIFVADCYLADVSGNTINGWQLVPAIKAVGPGSYLASQFPSNPNQASLKISGNNCWFKNNFQETVPAFNATSTTPSAIVVSGSYDSVSIEGNLVKADRFSSADSRSSAIPAISLSYALVGSIYYPATANISLNTISNWIGRGIDIAGIYTQLNTGCVISGNNVSGVGNIGIHGLGANGMVIVANNVSNVGSGSGHPGIFIEGPGSSNSVANCVVSNNNVFGRQDGGTNTMTYGIAIDFATAFSVIGNSIRAAATAPISNTNQAGEVKIFLTDGYPRTNALTPVGALFPLYIGEQIYATTAGKWWQAHAVGSNTAWTQITN